jgi:DNA-binding NtrC family response regulator
MVHSQVLVVEDDPVILMTAAQTLRQAGFAVIEAQTADEAATILQAAFDHVHVVFSDIEMPGDLDGLALAHIVSEVWPKISVVLTSGRVVPCRSMLPCGTRFVEKPYDMDHLASLIISLAET